MNRELPLLPGATIGVLGGGQLGRMLALAARRMGYRICVLDRDVRCPTGQVADDVVVGTLDDVDAAMTVAQRSSVVTLDTEHVPAELLAAIATTCPVRPSPSVLATIQDRAVQKQFLDREGLPQTPWAPVDGPDQLAAALAVVGAPAILKARRAGYDGKGQTRVDATTDPAAAWRRIGSAPAVLEAVVEFTREVSVVLARAVDGEIRVYPLAENVHRRHVLHTTRAPAPMSQTGRRVAESLATHVARALGHVGVLAVEMFELGDGGMLINEIAPRTHNSGHYTYGAAATSQFEQHVRAVCGLPLGEARLLSGAVMVNLTGDLWEHGEPHWHHVLVRPEARLHLYGKLTPAPGRKMGHVLLLDDDTERGLATAEQLLEQLGEPR